MLPTMIEHLIEENITPENFEKIKVTKGEKITVKYDFDKIYSAFTKISIKCNEIRLKAPLRLRRIDKLITQPYPGFPTDAQAPIMTLTVVADGTSVIVENIFESRFKHVPELLRMGAKITVDGKSAFIEGVEGLKGAPVVANDLRAGAAMVIAGLVASGTTEIEEIHHIQRGYDNIIEKLRSLGADIELRNSPDDEKTVLSVG